MDKLDKNTYGSSPAAERLAALLNEINDPKAIRRVGKIYGRMRRGFEGLARMTVDCKEDRDNRETLMRLWRDAKIYEAEKTKSLPPIIASYLVNLITTKYRISRKVAKWLDDENLNSSEKYIEIINSIRGGGSKIS